MHATLGNKPPKDSFWIIWVTLALVIIMTSTKIQANETCEVWNYDTKSCETYAEQNTTLVKEWIEFY